MYSRKTVGSGIEELQLKFHNTEVLEEPHGKPCQKR